ncbi:MAG: hypothetical protein AXA67_01030 [Methylothermaceae bacteria B42]|nr:MAG: hypothetical protein AXA67_01030 [Methylothermaceae bacteria B42]HHJ38214.1 hypothetical protein [Methylothermaceae bacterium]
MISTFLRPLLNLSRWAISHPVWMMVLLTLGAGLSTYYAATHLVVDTDTTKMLDPNLPFMKKRRQLERIFPQDKDAILLVVESPVAEVSEEAARRLKKLLAPHKDVFRSIYLPTTHPFFDRYGLLYLETDDLQNLVNDLAQAQPFIAQLYNELSLRSLLSLLSKAFRFEEQLPVSLDPVANRIASAFEATLENRPYLLSWQELLFEPERAVGFTQHFVIISPILDHSLMLPAEKAITTLKSVIKEVSTIDGIPVQVKMTGEPVLEYEELLSITRGTEIAGLASLALVLLALLFGFRSWKLALATLITLALGLAYSIGFAALAVGSLNLISMAFAVLYIGMGVDYATHLALRYREYRLEDHSPKEALLHSLRTVSPSLFLCAVTTALALYAFIPTPYKGISELGIIAGTSMFIVVFVTLAAMPALITLLPLKPTASWKNPRTLFLPESVAMFPYRHDLSLRRATFFLALISLGLLCGIEVDFNPVNLRDPNSESVQTFKELLRTKETSPMFLTALGEGEAETRILENRFEQLTTVEAAVSVFDLIPQDQEDKLMLIDEMALILGPQLEQPLTLQKGKTSLTDLKTFLKKLQQTSTTALTEETATRLETALKQLIEQCQALPQKQCQTRINHLEFTILGTFPKVMEKMRQGLEAGPIGVEDLPEDIRARWVSEHDIYRIDVLPAQDMNILGNVREFVREVRQAYPDITGLPVIYIESMRVIIGSFTQAFATAIILITVLLLAILRNTRETFQVLLPLIMATVITGAVTAIIHLPFNYANIIVLPLLFGLGVDNGIHMVHRMRQLPPQRSILTTSTSRGIFFSALTTMFSFMSLAFISHAGIASMGKLLGIGLFISLVCTFFILPAFASATDESIKPLDEKH